MCGAIECASSEGQIYKIVGLPKSSCKETTSRSQAPLWLAQHGIQLLRRRILVLMVHLGQHLFCTVTALSKGWQKHCLPTLNQAFVLTICGHNFLIHLSNRDIYIDPGNLLENLCTCFFTDVYHGLWNNCLQFSILWELVYAIKSRLYRCLLLIWASFSIG